MPELSVAAVTDAARYADTWLAFRQRFERIPGVQVAVLHGDELVLSGAHGMADIEQDMTLTDRDLFRIASHSKMFTATAVARLVEQGRLRFDDPASLHLPFLVGGPLAAVTVRELLGHVGGLIRDGLAHDHWQLAAPFPDHRMLEDIASDGADIIPANERFKYSNIGYSLLGSLIEAVTGHTYAAHVTDTIIGPLGLCDTGPELDPKRSSDLAAGYTSLAYSDVRLPIEHIDTGAMAAATGFYATAADVARFCSAHFMGDERLLSDATKRLLHHDEWSVDATPTSYGLGFAIAEVGGRRTLGHGGGYPGHITRTMFDPIDRLCVSVFTNAIDGPATAMATTIVRLIDLAAAAGMRPRATVDPSRFTGRFASMWGVLDIVSLDDRLYGLHPAYADPLAEHSCFDVVDDDTLRISATTGYGSFGELLRFARASDGSVSSLTSAGMTMLPEATLRERVGIRTSVRLGASLLT